MLLAALCCYFAVLGNTNKHCGISEIVEIARHTDGNISETTSKCVCAVGKGN